MVSLATSRGKLQTALLLIDKAKADQIIHVARAQNLLLGNTKGYSAEGSFLVRTERCFKTAVHGLPPHKLKEIQNLGRALVGKTLGPLSDALLGAASLV